MAQQKVELVVAVKKIGTNWEGAVITNGSFARALVEESLETLVQKATLGAFIDRPEGTALSLNITTLLEVAE